MATANLSALQEAPARVRQAGEVIAGLDHCLLVGLGRLGGDEQGQLDRLGGASPARRCKGRWRRRWRA